MLKEQNQYQEFPFKSIYSSDSPRFALSLIFLGLVCTDLIHFSAQERFIFHPNMQSTTLSSAGIFDFIISFVATSIILIDTLKMEKTIISGKENIGVLPDKTLISTICQKVRPGRLYFKDGSLKSCFGGTLSLNIDIKANQAH